VNPLVTLLLAAGQKAVPERAPESSAHELWVWIESNSSVVYPAIAIVIVGLIVAALMASWKSDELNAEQRGQLKMKIMQIMRRRISGVNAQQVAAELQIDVSIAAKLLSELAEEGLVAAAAQSSNAPQQYRIRGSGGMD
jgi:hypothetical protein